MSVITAHPAVTRTLNCDHCAAVYTVVRRRGAVPKTCSEACRAERRRIYQITAYDRRIERVIRERLSTAFAALPSALPA